MDVNPTKEKKLTNVRSSTGDELERLIPARLLSMEQALEFCRGDECLEVTPAAVRIRKVVLSATSGPEPAPGPSRPEHITAGHVWQRVDHSAEPIRLSRPPAIGDRWAVASPDAEGFMMRFACMLLGIAMATGLLTGLSAAPRWPSRRPRRTTSRGSTPSPKKGETNIVVRPCSGGWSPPRCSTASGSTATSAPRPRTGSSGSRSKSAAGRRQGHPAVWNLLVAKTGKIKITKAKPKTKIAKRCETGPGAVRRQDQAQALLRQGRKIIKTMDARFGCAGTRTREGTFQVFRKSRHWTSSIFGSPMPYAMFFSGGQAVHYSPDFSPRLQRLQPRLRQHPRQQHDRWIFDQIRVGDRVVVYRS